LRTASIGSPRAGPARRDRTSPQPQVGRALVLREQADEPIRLRIRQRLQQHAAEVPSVAVFPATASPWWAALLRQLEQKHLARTVFRNFYDDAVARAIPGWRGIEGAERGSLLRVCRR